MNSTNRSRITKKRKPKELWNLRASRHYLAGAMHLNTPSLTLCILLFTEGTVDPADIEDLFDQLEDYSDSGPDADTISIGSTPKPSLKPFFCSSRNLLHEARSVVAAAAVAKAQSKTLYSLFSSLVALSVII